MDTKTENNQGAEINSPEKAEGETGKSTGEKPTTNKLSSPKGEFIEWAESTSTNY